MGAALFIEIDRELKDEFKSEVARRGSDMRGEVIVFIKNYIKRKKEQKNGGRKN